MGLVNLLHSKQYYGEDTADYLREVRDIINSLSIPSSRLMKYNIAKVTDYNLIAPLSTINLEKNNIISTSKLINNLKTFSKYLTQKKRF